MAMLHYQGPRQTIGIIDLSWTLGMAHSRYNLWSRLILWCFTKIYEPSNCGLPRKCKAGILTDKTRTSFRTCRTCWMIGKWRVAVYLQSPIKLRLASSLPPGWHISGFLPHTLGVREDDPADDRSQGARPRGWDAPPSSAWLSAPRHPSLAPEASVFGRAVAVRNV